MDTVPATTNQPAQSRETCARVLRFARHPESMKSYRTAARGLLLTIALGLAAAASAAPAGEVPSRIVFPVIGPATFFPDFGDSRPQGRHEGNDIMSVRRALAVAAEAGRVEFETGSGRAGCMLRLRGESSTEYVYIHLNNDVTRGNDNRGGCETGVAFPKGLSSGETVGAGQPVGYVGDSGDADGIQPHLHFEIHPNGGAAINPYRYLKAAQRLLFYAPLGRTFVLRLTGTVIQSEAGQLRLKVDALRWWPNGLQVTNVARTVALDASGAVVEQGPTGAARAFATASKGQRVNVFTEPAATTRAAQLGKAGKLVAARIVLLDG